MYVSADNGHHTTNVNRPLNCASNREWHITRVSTLGYHSALVIRLKLHWRMLFLKKWMTRVLHTSGFHSFLASVQDQARIFIEGAIIRESTIHTIIILLHCSCEYNNKYRTLSLSLYGYLSVHPSVHYGRSAETIWPQDTRGCISGHWVLEGRVRQSLWMAVIALATCRHECKLLG